MNRTLLQAQSLYADMGKAERRVADWLLSHPGEVLPFAIRELATACDTSEATIVRFSRRLGFNGYQELKLSLASEAEKRIIAPNITAEDSCFDVFEKICNDAYLSLERTKKTLSAPGMAAAADAIAAAGRVVLIGLGSSASVASDASDKLLRACCNSASYGDTHMQTIAVSRLLPGDVLIGISHSGSSKDIVDAMRIAKERGATTVSITSKERSPITRQSDIVLLTDTEEVRHSSLGLSSHLSRLLVLDALCYRVVYKNEEKVREMLSNAETSLRSKRVT
ncbi:MAG: MurR/RpiR family transcriptional regulator [Clostridia bacterium]|nr:MurR/RpiR family transcriptional regulator [Clostridia bacterium]